jgi:hypothetical protein
MQSVGVLGFIYQLRWIDVVIHNTRVPFNPLRILRLHFFRHNSSLDGLLIDLKHNVAICVKKLLRYSQATNPATRAAFTLHLFKWSWGRTLALRDYFLKLGHAFSGICCWVVVFARLNFVKRHGSDTPNKSCNLW